MGDFQPDAHVNGFVGSNLIALLCSKYWGIKLKNSVMPQEYKIFYNDRAIVLTSKITKSFENIGGLFYNYQKNDELNDLLKAFEQFEHISSLHIYHFDVDILLDKIKLRYTIVEAAGGVVRNPEGKLLVIFRRGKWDLPKGKMDKGETHKQTALREVQEECGLTHIDVGQRLDDTYHFYVEKNTRILKRTAWFEMTVNGYEQPVPQLSEDITKIEWFSNHNINNALDNTFESLKDVFSTQINR